MTLPLDLDIFWPVLVAHQGMDVDRRGTGTSPMKCRPIIIIRATQKKMMSKPVTSTSVGIIARRARRLLGPAQGRERPQRRARTRCRARRSSRRQRRPAGRSGLGGGLQRLGLGLLDEDRAVRPVPGRNLMAPPDLARDAPGLDVAHPVEIGVLPVLGHEARCAPLFHRLDRRLGQGRGVDDTIGRSARARSPRPSGRRRAPS